jgi:hypothetical protein
MTKLDLTTKYFLEIIIIMFIAYSMFGMAYGQNTSIKPVQPTVTIPAQTQPNPNLQYLPQKAYVQAFGPEYGLPVSPTPLQSITPPQVQPAPAVQQNTVFGIDPATLAGIVGTLGAGVAYFKGHLANKKADKAEETGKENSAMNVKQAIISEEALKLQYENMPDKGNNITDKPEIRLTEVAKMKDKAVDTATKS